MHVEPATVLPPTLAVSATQSAFASGQFHRSAVRAYTRLRKGVFFYQAVNPNPLRYVSRSCPVRIVVAVTARAKASSIRMLHVLRVRYVFKIVWSIIKSVAVNVVNFLSFGARTNKGCCYQSVHNDLFGLPVFAQVQVGISSVTRFGFKNVAGLRISHRNGAFNSSQIGNGIGVFVIGNRKPYFGSKLFSGKINNSHSVFSRVENGLIRLAGKVNSFWRAVSILPQNLDKQGVLA